MGAGNAESRGAGGGRSIQSWHSASSFGSSGSVGGGGVSGGAAAGKEKEGKEKRREKGKVK